MEDYFKEPIEKKLFYNQFDEVSQIAYENDKEYYELEQEQCKASENLINFIKNKLADEEYSEFNKLVMNSELANGAKEQYVCYLFYKLGLSDGVQINKRFIK